MTVSPIQAPVTGGEDLGDLSRPEQALAQFYKALNDRDLALAGANWENCEEAVMDNPLGGVSRGWTEIRRVYERLSTGPARVRAEFWDYTLHETGDVFWAVGRERGRLEAPDKTIDLAIRTTRLFRRAGGRWRQVHHHGSIDDPALLVAYRTAVAR